MHSRELWIFLFLAGIVLFNWPFTAISGGSVPVYVFAAWAAFIALMRLLASREGSGGGGD